MAAKELRITRPDGTLVYMQIFDPDKKRFSIGRLIVEDGQLKLCADELDDIGSIVTPDSNWFGDLNFSVTEVKNG